MTTRATIVGGTGYTGGELLRLLLGHPTIEIGEVTSRSMTDRPIHQVHPNLRGCLSQSFIAPSDVSSCDIVFLCMPHGEASREIDRWQSVAPLVIDLSADFRLRSATEYQTWYGETHARPELLESAVYGLPEISRERLATARLISGVGCNATAMTLALLPLARAGLIERVIADIKVGSSEGGASANAGSHHPVRSRAVRTYSPSGHRHCAEVIQSLGVIDLDCTVSAIEMVRGVLCTAHVQPTERIDQKTLWKLYREAYQHEPFVRIVAEKTGMNRLPDPRVLAGSNFADVGFAIDERSGRIIALAAIDNLVKGAAGSAIQAMNIALGLEETTGLSFPGLHPA
jgi:N-acetyl-gamma-glutamyl-phosphate/LysW-gamma-L-alpha-aminoadipyl-6-phosphate reductase